MNEVCASAKEFLTSILNDLRFDLSVSAKETAEGFLFDLEGEDSSLLLAESGELLDAFETILFQVYGKQIDHNQRFLCDAEGFRQTRKAELQAMARFAAQNVQKTGKSFTFGVLNSTERRIIHTTLAEETDLLTESIGQGKERRLQVRLK